MAQATQDSAQHHRARLLGVFDSGSGEPVEGAEVQDVAARVSARTTKTGTVSLMFLQGDGSLVRVTKLGYRPAALFIATGPADTTPVTVLLSAAATALPAVVTRDSAPTYISPGLREFDERRRFNGGGTFIAEAELRKAGSRKLSDVLRVVPGMRVDCSPSECYVATSRQTKRAVIIGSRCYADIYLDGALVSNSSDPIASQHDVDRFVVRDLAGVEFYAGPASMPAAYNKTGSSCGVLLLWSRER
jgi:hypothetical protein